MASSGAAFEVVLDRGVTARARWVEGSRRAPRPRGVVAFIAGLGGAPATSPTPLASWLSLWASNELDVLIVDPASATHVGGGGYEDLSLEDEIELHVAGLVQAMAERPAGLPLILFGHSLGAVLAPRVARQIGARNLVVHGSPVEPWSEVLARGARRQLTLAGLSKPEIEREHRLATRLYSSLLRTGRTAVETFASDRELVECIAARDVRGETLHGRALSFFRALEAVEPKAVWQRWSGDALIVAGGLDWIAFEQDPDDIAGWVGAAGGTAAVLRAPDLDHDGARFESMRESFAGRGAGPSHARVAEQVMAWILARCAAAG